MSSFAGSESYLNNEYFIVFLSRYHKYGIFELPALFIPTSSFVGAMYFKKVSLE